ncbi:MAG: hypothetical protein ACOCRX_10015 [Candidatus Woesearchaeota archaeon]
MLNEKMNLIDKKREQKLTYEDEMATLLAMYGWEMFVNSGGIEIFIDDNEVIEWIDKFKCSSAGRLINQEYISKNIQDYNRKSTNIFVYSFFNNSICDKCRNSVVMIIKRDKNLKVDSNLIGKSFLTIPYRKTDPLYLEYMNNNIPLLINPKKDWWYCPICNDLHGFDYSKETGLKFDQRIIDPSNK